MHDGFFFLIPHALDNCNKNRSGSNEFNNYYLSLFFYLLFIAYIASVLKVGIGAKAIMNFKAKKHILFSVTLSCKM